MHVCSVAAGRRQRAGGGGAPHLPVPHWDAQLPGHRRRDTGWEGILGTGTCGAASPCSRDASTLTKGTGGLWLPLAPAPACLHPATQRMDAAMR